VEMQCHHTYPLLLCMTILIIELAIHDTLLSIPESKRCGHISKSFPFC
jgi:hypothetical protein